MAAATGRAGARGPAVDEQRGRRRPRQMDDRSRTIRQARPADLDAVDALEGESFTADRISRRSYRRLLARSSATVLVATETTGEVVGSLVLLFRKGSHRARIYSLAVTRAARKSGIGRNLLAAAEKSAAERGAGTVVLEVRADNLDAIRLYERLGYRATGRKKDYYADGEAAISMVRTLGSTAASA